MSLPYPTKVVLPFDIATAQDMNERHANDVALAAGTGLDDGAVTASKTSFGGNFTASEVNTGFTWVDGKTIYKKTIDCGALPNATQKLVNHGITGATQFLSVSGFASNGTPGTVRPLPYVSATLAQQVSVTVTSTQIDIFTGSNLSAYVNTFITLLYVK